jgi:hypothetical protein
MQHVSYLISIILLAAAVAALVVFARKEAERHGTTVKQVAYSAG